MTDDYAIEGEEGAYVPCDEAPSPLNAAEEGAIFGIGTGFVAREQEAAEQPVPEREAIVGSVGAFVPRPCGCACPGEPTITWTEHLSGEPGAQPEDITLDVDGLSGSIQSRVSTTDTRIPYIKTTDAWVGGDVKIAVEFTHNQTLPRVNFSNHSWGIELWLMDDVSDVDDYVRLRSLSANGFPANTSFSLRPSTGSSLQLTPAALEIAPVTYMICWEWNKTLDVSRVKLWRSDIEDEPADWTLSRTGAPFGGPITLVPTSFRIGLHVDDAIAETNPEILTLTKICVEPI